MTCTGSYATPLQFSAFWCASSYLSRVDDSGGAGNAFLTDSQASFVNAGVKANVGMILYNKTENTSGPITAVTATILTATGVTWTDGDEYELVTLSALQEATIKQFLDMTAADISAALAANNSCDCSWQSWVPAFLAKLNVIEAGALYNCPCNNLNLSEDQQTALLTWATAQIEKIQKGDIPICVGDTGKGYPAFGIIQLGHTAWSEAEIIDGYNARTP